MAKRSWLNGLLDTQQFHFEDQCGIGADGALRAALQADAQENEAIEEEAVVEVVEIEVEAAEEGVEDPEWAAPVADKQTLDLRAAVQVQRALVRRACGLTADQEKALERLDGRWVDEIVATAGKKENAVPKPHLILQFLGVNPAEVSRANPNVALKQALKNEIDRLLTDDQKRRYESEVRSRDQFRAEATAAAVVETLHERLALTAEQAEEIQESIQVWAAKTGLEMMPYFSNQQFYPNVPEHLLKPHLNEQQLKLYRSLSRHLFTAESFNDGQPHIVIER